MNRSFRRGTSIRRGTILLAVMLVITLSALAATTAMYLGEASGEGSRMSLKRTRSRAMAWSGVQAVMAELADQRDKLLDGENPLITTQWQLFEEAGRRGVVRLIALAKDDTAQEQWILSEATRLDLNSATADMLLKIPGITKELAAAIVAARQQGFSSIDELVRVPGMKPELLWGETEHAVTNAEPSAAPGGTLDSFLTVFAFDPNVQAGIDPAAPDLRGKLRLNLNTPWSESLETALKDRFGADAAANAKKLFDKGASFKTLKDLCGVFQQERLPTATWPTLLDSFTNSPDPFIGGRVDINRAPAAVLAAIPGFTPEAADEVVKVRQSLDAAARRTIMWPVTQGILKEDKFMEAVDYLTTRSMQWRVRVEVGMMESESSSAREPALEDRLVLEAVIDVASERPRVAYLRDVTLLDSARVMNRDLSVQAERRPAVVADNTAPEPETPPAKLDTDAGLKLSGVLDFGSEEPPAPVAVPPAEPPAVAPAPAEGVDRRIGRWTSRTGEPPVDAAGSGEAKP